MITINKKLSDINSNSYIYSIISLLIFYYSLTEYLDRKEVFEKGKITFGLVEKIYCNSSKKNNSSIDLKIINENIVKSLQLNYEACRQYSEADTVSILYLKDNKPILKYDANIKAISKVKLYFSLFFLLLGIFSLIFSFNTSYLPKDIKRYKKGERHV
jgi:hypothetical protein